MREILFRGKSLDNGEWVEGSLVNQCEQSFIDVFTLTKNDLKIIYPNDYDGFFTHHNFIQVNPNTVGQYTGLCDKNGTKIFGGDIVRKQIFDEMRNISKYKNEQEFKEHKEYLIKRGCIFDSEYKYHRNYDFVVVWELNGFYPFADSPENCGHCGGAEDNLKCEVIGNIYDNPELLEKK